MREVSFIERTVTEMLDTSFITNCVTVETVLSTLEDDDASKELAVMEMEAHLASLESSRDVHMINDALVHAEACGMSREAVEKLRIRCESMKEQADHYNALKQCIACEDALKVQSVIQSATDAGFADGSKWVYSDGPAVFARAQAWLAEIERQASCESAFTKDLQNHAAIMNLSGDIAGISSLLTSVSKQGGESDVTRDLQKRCETLSKQEDFANKVLACRPAFISGFLSGVRKSFSGGPSSNVDDLEKTMAALREADLATPDGWIVPDGAYLVARLQQWITLLHKVEDSESSAATTAASLAAGKPEQDAAAALKACLAEKADIDRVRKAVDLAHSGGFASTGSWTLPSGPSLMALGETLLEALEEQEEAKAGHGFAHDDLEVQMHILKPLLQSLADMELTQRLDSRCQNLHAQLPVRRHLQLAASSGAEGELVKALETAKESELHGDSNWVLPDGVIAHTRASAKLDGLRGAKEAHEAARNAVEAELKELADSSDLNAMSTCVAKAKGCAADAAVLAPVEARLNSMREQLEMRKELRSCALSDDRQHIADVTHKMTELGYDSPDKWILSDGSKLFARALERLGCLDELEAVKNRITKAARLFDAREMHAAFTEANDAGIPQSSYTRDHNVFLKIQDGEFVQNKSTELAKHANDGDAYVVMVNNLNAQLDELGLRTDSHDMKEVAKALLTKRRQSVPNASEVFEDLENFSRLRDPLNWGVRGVASKEEEVNQDVMLVHSLELLPQSLTELDEEADARACRTFHELLRFAGDKAGIAAYSSSVQPIIVVAKRGESMASEVYIQVMKQLTKNPSVESMTRYWQVMRALCEATKPNEEMRRFVEAFLKKPFVCETDDGDDGVSSRSLSRTRKESVMSRRNSKKSRSASMLDVEQRGVPGISRVEFLQNTAPKLASACLKALLDTDHEGA
jgi:hypothetical protein